MRLTSSHNERTSSSNPTDCKPTSESPVFALFHPCQQKRRNKLLQRSTIEFSSIEIMKFVSTLLLAFAMLVAATSAFAPSSSVASGTGSAFAIRQRVGVVAPPPSRSHANTRSELYMGGKMSKFGLFSPAVYGAKIVLGGEKLNKIRGKAISLHSEKIGDFCQWVGAYHLRTKLIKKAKTNGDILGFLV